MRKILHIFIGHDFFPEKNPFYHAMKNLGKIVYIKETCDCGAERIKGHLVEK